VALGQTALLISKFSARNAKILGKRERNVNSKERHEDFW
jgi:hypothetical protein